MPELLDSIEIETAKNPAASIIWLHGLGADGENRREDERGVRASQVLIETLIGREKERGTAARRLVLAGFSQGGAIALQTGLRHPERIAGIMALSAYVPVGEKLPAEASAANRDVPIFMAHGSHDPIVPLARAE